MTSKGLLLKSRQGRTARYMGPGLFAGSLLALLLTGPTAAQNFQVESPPEPQVVQPLTNEGEAPAIPNAIAGEEAVVESAPQPGDALINPQPEATTVSASQKNQVQPSNQMDAGPGPMAQAENTGNPGADTTDDGQPAAAAGAAELSGFNEAPWETSFKEVRKMMKDLSSSPKSDDKVELLYEQKNRLLTIRRNDVVYIYRFYQPPEKILEFKVSGTGTATAAAASNNELDKHPEYKYGRLFFVTMQLPLLTAKDVRGALSAKYNKPTQPLTDDDGAGVLIWNLNGGFIFQWIEKFDGKLYTRRVDYISAKVRAELADDYQLYFSAKEKKLLKDAKF